MGRPWLERNPSRGSPPDGGEKPDQERATVVVTTAGLSTGQMGLPEAASEAGTRFELAWKRQKIASVFGVSPKSPRVELHLGRIKAPFGPWVVEAPADKTGRRNTAGPIHPALGDLGLTFLPTAGAGVGVTSRHAVPTSDPTRIDRHTVTVEDRQVLRKYLAVNRSQSGPVAALREHDGALRQWTTNAAMAATVSPAGMSAVMAMFRLLGVVHQLAPGVITDQDGQVGCAITESDRRNDRDRYGHRGALLIPRFGGGGRIRPRGCRASTGVRNGIGHRGASIPNTVRGGPGRRGAPTGAGQTPSWLAGSLHRNTADRPPSLLVGCAALQARFRMTTSQFS